MGVVTNTGWRTTQVDAVTTFVGSPHPRALQCEHPQVRSDSAAWVLGQQGVASGGIDTTLIWQTRVGFAGVPTRRSMMLVSCRPLAMCRALNGMTAKYATLRNRVSAVQRGIFTSREVSGGGLEPPRPLRALAPQASASAIPPPGPGDARVLVEARATRGTIARTRTQFRTAN